MAEEAITKSDLQLFAEKLEEFGNSLGAKGQALLYVLLERAGDDTREEHTKFDNNGFRRAYLEGSSRSILNSDLTVTSGPEGIVLGGDLRGALGGPSKLKLPGVFVW